MGVGFQGIQDDVDEDDDVVVAGFGIALHLPATPPPLSIFRASTPGHLHLKTFIGNGQKGGYSQMVH